MLESRSARAGWGGVDFEMEFGSSRPLPDESGVEWCRLPTILVLNPEVLNSLRALQSPCLLSPISFLQTLNLEAWPSIDFGFLTSGL